MKVRFFSIQLKLKLMGQFYDVRFIDMKISFYNKAPIELYDTFFYFIRADEVDEETTHALDLNGENAMFFTCSENISDVNNIHVSINNENYDITRVETSYDKNHSFYDCYCYYTPFNEKLI